jgi:hypothetical protein
VVHSSPQSEFVETIEAAGVAAIEVLARGLKAPPGSYAPRSLSFERIEYELVEDPLTPERRTDLRPRVSAPARGDTADYTGMIYAARRARRSRSPAILSSANRGLSTTPSPTVWQASTSSF